MFRNIFIILVVSILISGCTSLSEIRADNRQKLTGLSIGMSKQDVLGKMGTKTVGAQNTVVTNPYRTEMYRSNGHVFELLLYYTDIKKSDGAITDDELTPLIIMDGKLDGWGWSYWNNVIKKYEIRVR